METSDPIQSLSAQIAAQSYREFLAASLLPKTPKGRKLSYAELSRRAGFSSRSYPADVINGHRRVTHATLPQFIRGLGLKGDLRTYFTMLVFKDENDLNHARMSQDEIGGHLSRLRERLQARNRPPTDIKATRFYGSESWLEIFAALGSVQYGATIEEISTRTKIPLPQCEGAIQSLMLAGAVVPDAITGRYRAVSPHVIFDRLGGDAFFQKHYLAMMSRMSRQAAGPRFRDPETLFLTSVFSIDRRRAPELRARLRQLLVEFVDTSEEPSGDSVAKLLIGFIPEG